MTQPEDKHLTANDKALRVGLPPGPRFRFLHPVAYGQSPYRFFRKVHARWGDPFTIRTLAITAVTAHPEGIKQIFSGKPENFYVKLSKSQSRVLGTEGLTSLHGHAHRRARKLIAPIFHGSSLKALGSMIHETAVEKLQQWRPGESLVMREAMLDIGLNVILKTVFGAEDAQRLALFRSAVLDFTRAFGNPIFLLSGLLQLHSDRWPPNQRVDLTRGQLRALILENIAARRATGTADRLDMLSRLMEARFEDGSALSDESLVDDLITNLIAGHETSVLTLTWAFAWLGRHPEIAAQLQAEIDTLSDDANIDEIQKLPFLDAVIKECLRLYPAVRVLSRG